MEIRKFAVIGHPISHTMSPFIHERLFSLSGYNPQYDILDIENIIKSEDLLSSYDGLNVTIPHKANIMDILNQIDPKAKRFGSVNTVKMDNLTISGYTTDGAGAVQAICESGGNVHGSTIILGNGGAARAIAFEMENYSKDITIAARSYNKAKVLADEIKNCTATTIENAINNQKKYDLLINATSVGMYPNTNACPASLELINSCDCVFDAVYNPCDTILLKTAKELGKKIVYGMDMLVYQAVVAHEIWYGACFSREDVVQLIEDAKQECKIKFKGK